jgi:hypothetical protein
MPAEVPYFGKLAINRALEATGVGGASHRDSWTWFVLSSLTGGRGTDWSAINANRASTQE